MSGASGLRKHGHTGAGDGGTIASGSAATDTIYDAKGDLAVGTGADTAAKLTVGANDTIPMADSAATTGIKWVASQTPSTQAYGDAAAQGTADTYARGDHKHAMPAASLPWFNVRNYGAVGDGTTDDTTAFNSTIAALIAAGAGVLYIPASSAAYKITAGTSTISVPATVQGDGWMTGASGPISRISFTSTTGTLFTVSANGCTFRDFAMIQTGGTATAGAAITSTGGVLADYEHLEFDGFYIGIDQENGSIWAARRCYFGTTRKYGIKIRNTATPDAGDWNITDCYFSTGVAADAAIRIESSGGGKISGTKVNGGTGTSNFDYGVDLALITGADTSILLISNCSIENVSEGGIRGTTSAATSKYGAIEISNNEIMVLGNTAKAISLVATTAADFYSVILANNVYAASGTGRSAMQLTNCNAVVIGSHVLISSFTSVYTATTCTNLHDYTGGVAGVDITGTPSSGDVPIASSGTAAVWGAPTVGNVATDALWDAAGDLAVGTGANTAAKLTKGSAGGALSMINGVVTWNSGTSNPGSAVAGDRFWRTDLGREVTYNGTNWVSKQEFRDTFGVGNVLPPDTIATAIGRMTPWSTAFDLWLVAWSLSTYVAGTNNGTNFWVITLTKNDAADATTNIDSFDTSGDTVNNWTQRRRLIGASYTASAYRLFAVNTALTLSPGGLYFSDIALEYQLIIP